ncbi:microtubule-associated protein 10-like [Watersipora subatra]|uniref:microtubule-associated protein 10-like n=1 Tax=Watersipora subatra TaxID=2589382 RepID=UPI00355C32D8
MKECFNMFVTDSLFSLEFTVDKLTISPGVVCRFPSVAFRFLDFPTVSLHFLDEVQRDRLRAKLTIDPEYTVPDQIKDYQNKSGFYEFNSGKSCLYRIPPDDLRTLLAQVPLYIIIADGFSPTPTLVGSATLPLTEAMDEVYELLLKDGVSVPASSGIRSSLTVHNLMGHAIGQVLVGCRLSSLGMALLTHLPENSVVSHKHCEAGLYMPSVNTATMATTPSKAMVEEHNISHAMADLETKEAAERYPLVLVDKQLQTTQVIEKDTQTSQTDKRQQKQQLELRRLDEVDEGIELVVPEVYCPPPLYYNKASIAQRTIPFQPSADVSEASENQTSHTTPLIESQFGKPLTASVADDAVVSQDPKEKATPLDPPKLPKVFNEAMLAPDAYPLLSALFSEIMSVGVHQEHPLPNVASTPVKSPRGKRRQEAPSPIARAQSAMESRKPTPSPRARLSSPPPRPQSKHGNRKGPLVFGYTNTQKLRLSKTNPDMLRRIEEAEAANKLRKDSLTGQTVVLDRNQKATKLRMPKGRRADGPRSFRSYTSQQNLDMSTEMGRLSRELAEVKRDVADQRALRTPRLDVTTQGQEVNLELGITRIITPAMSKVLPAKHSSLTPRRSLSALSNRTSRDGADLSTLHEQSFQSDSRRSLEIHLPTPDLQEVEGRDFMRSSQGSSESHRGKTQSSKSTGHHERENVSLDMGDDYSLTNSPSGWDNSSPLGIHRYSYGSDSFASEG